jgi:hypothetical protein
MEIKRVKDKFLITDISQLEVQIIGDAFSMARANLAEMLKLKDEEILANFKIPESKLALYKNSFRRNFEFFDKHFKKIMSYVSS